MTDALGEFDEFSIECIVHDRDDSGVLYEQLYASVPEYDDGDFYLVHFIDEGHPRIVQANVGAGERFVIEAEIDPHMDTECHSLAEAIQEMLEGSSFSVVHECGSTRYYIVSEVEGS